MLHQPKHLIPPALLIATMTVISQGLGVFRDHLLAKVFGAAAGAGIFDLDVYYAAFRIPDFLYKILIFGAISASFIPIFTRYKKEGDFKNAWEFANSMLHWLILILLALSGFAYLLATPFARLIAAGFTADQIALTAKLMRIMLLSPILFGISAVFIGIQDSFKTFFYRSLAPVVYNLGIISAVYLFAQNFGVVGVTWGVIGGAFLQLIIQLPALKAVGFKHIWIMGGQRPDVRKAFILLLPRLFGTAVNQIVGLVSTLIASFLATGSITILYFADNLQSIPLGTISIAYAITTFATLSELASEPTHEKFAIELKKIMGQVLFLALPAMFGIFVLRDEIIKTLFLYGKFTIGDAVLTSLVLAILVASSFAQALTAILARGFYSHHDTKTPFYAGVLAALSAIGGSYFLGLRFGLGVTGIAIAYSFGNFVNFFSLIIAMRHKVKQSILDLGAATKMVLSSVVMAGSVFIIKLAWPMAYRGVAGLMYLGVLILLGAIAYFVTAHFLKIKEWRNWLNRLGF